MRDAVSSNRTGSPTLKPPNGRWLYCCEWLLALARHCAANARLRLSLAGVILLLGVVGRAHSQQPSTTPITPENAQAAQTAQKTPTDVAILVMPTARDEARLGLVYRKQLSHRQVCREILRLRDFGWQVQEPITIEDNSVHPERPDRFPRTTGAEFYVRNATHIAEGFPALAPCLHAFQQWSSLELIIGVNGNTALSAQSNVDSPDVAVTQVTGDGVIRYEAVIRRHTGAIHMPTPVRPTEPKPLPTPGAMTHTATPADSLPSPLILVVVGIALFIIGVLILTRRHGKIPATRTSQR